MKVNPVLHGVLVGGEGEQYLPLHGSSLGGEGEQCLPLHGSSFGGDGEQLFPLHGSSLGGDGGGVLQFFPVHDGGGTTTIGGGDGGEEGVQDFLLISLTGGEILRTISCVGYFTGPKTLVEL